jgi:hypothetical protein
MKIEGSGSASGSGSISQRHGSADPDTDPDQNVMDSQHCRFLSFFCPKFFILVQVCLNFCYSFRAKSDISVTSAELPASKEHASTRVISAQTGTTVRAGRPTAGKTGQSAAAPRIPTSGLAASLATGQKSATKAQLLPLGRVSARESSAVSATPAPPASQAAGTGTSERIPGPQVIRKLVLTRRKLSSSSSSPPSTSATISKNPAVLPGGAVTAFESVKKEELRGIQPLGSRRQLPAAVSEQRPRPAADSQQRSRPAAGSEQRPRPAAGSEQRSRPAASSEQRSQQAASSEQRPRPAAGNEQRLQPAAASEQRPRPAAGRYPNPKGIKPKPTTVALHSDEVSRSQLLLAAGDLDLGGLRLPPMPLITSAPRRTPLQHPDPIVASFQARVAESRDPRLVKLIGNSSSSCSTATTTAAVPVSTTAVAPGAGSVTSKTTALSVQTSVDNKQQADEPRRSKSISPSSSSSATTVTISDSVSRLSPMGLAELTPSLEAAAAVLDALSSLQLAARGGGGNPPVAQSNNPRSLSLPPPEALVVAKPANRLQLPTPVPAGTPDSSSGNPARCGKGGGTASTAFVEPAGRQRYLEALDQGPGEAKVSF